MNIQTDIDDKKFKRILSRNIILPIAIGLVTAALFVGLILNLLSTIKWVEHTERTIGSANVIGKLGGEMESSMRGFLIADNEDFLAPYRIGKPAMLAEIASLSELVSDNPPQIARLNRFQEQLTQWDKYANEMIELRRHNLDYLTPVKAGLGKMQFDEMRNLLDAFVSSEQRLLQERNATARTTTLLSLTIYLLFIMVVNVFLAINGRRELLRLSTSYSNILEQQKQYSNNLEQQAWLRMGQAELADLGIGQLALPQLGRTALDFLARYLGATVGALYVREDDGELRRVASYGFSRESLKRNNTIQENEGLIGQSVSEDRIIHLRDVPEDYIKVNSSLGDMAPKNILIVPIDNDININGAVELGFVHDISERDLEFMKLIAGNLGTSVETTLSRQRLQDVLAETQQLNEELQVQQEELRTSNEELDEQSRVLEESQVNLENQRAELEQTNEQLAEQALALDQKNATLYEIQEELKSRAQDLEQASQYKSEFLANMSHELRTPLNSSLILAKILSDNTQGNLNEEQVKFAQTIYSAGNDLLNLINDILDISKVEAGKLELSPEKLHVRRLAEALKTSFMPSAAQKNLQLSLQIQSDIPEFVTTDKQRLEQILKNLFSNAIKFTAKGGITLNVSQDSPEHISFAVQDSGIGIDAKHLESIFEAFHQADGTINRRYGGTGLGLSISRELAKLLGGTLEVASTPGKGSTFTLTIPRTWSPAEASPLPLRAPAPAPAPVLGTARKSRLQKSQAETADAAINHPLQTPVGATFPDDREGSSKTGRSVLVIEDEPEFARILYTIAHEMGYQCLVAHAAEEGLRLAVQFMPDAILLDMRLPDQSGLSVLQQLKENPQTRHIPVHVVSAADQSEEALHLGAIGYAIKPTTRDELVNVFQRLEDKFTQKIKRVLLVEDDVRQRESMLELISDTDVEIMAVGSGEEALHLLRSTIFDCMIIDLKLPDMQGNELLEQMSSEEICSFPPVIVYTGRNLTREEEADLLTYSRSIIIKGARSPERLLDEVTLFLHSVESQLSTERQKMLKTIRNRERVFDGRKILLVDDDVRNVFALTSALEQKGIIVEVARNGLEAISKLDEVPDIDLVLMDIMMPEMDGLEATRRIRRDPRFKRLPIIAITAKAMKDDQEQCIAAGTNDYLAKPIDLLRLHSLLRVWMPNIDRIY